MKQNNLGLDLTWFLSLFFPTVGEQTAQLASTQQTTATWAESSGCERWSEVSTSENFADTGLTHSNQCCVDANKFNIHSVNH